MVKKLGNSGDKKKTKKKKSTVHQSEEEAKGNPPLKPRNPSTRPERQAGQRGGPKQRVCSPSDF